MRNECRYIKKPLISLDYEKLDAGDLLNNPEIILYSLLEDAEKTKNLIPSIEMLQNWCYSIQNYFPKEFMDEIANILGPEFSGKRCAEEQQKIKDAIKRQEIHERIASNQDSEMKFETHIETQEMNGPEIGNNQ